MYAKVRILWENGYIDSIKFATFFGDGLYCGKDNDGCGIQKKKQRKSFVSFICLWRIFDNSRNAICLDIPFIIYFILSYEGDLKCETIANWFFLNAIHKSYFHRIF